MTTLQLKQSMTAQQLALLQTEMDKNKRSAGLAYFLLFLFGALGMHQIYLRNKKRAMLFFSTLGMGLFLWLGGTAAIVSNAVHAAHNNKIAPAGHASVLFGVLGVLLVFGGFILSVIDLFTLHKQTDAANEEIEAKIIAELHAVTPNAA